MLNAYIADGTYAKVLEAWGLESEGVDKSEINPPGLRSPDRQRGSVLRDRAPPHAVREEWMP
ncbi:hypothetical protein HR12_29485 [Microbacterium sp. SUBG005]|nr:hypothetical protein HR12_29485 [Microbacterium sp. SUBG005]